MQVGRLTEARNLFDEMPQRDLYSWNTLIFGYTQAGRLAEARNLFYKMPQRDKFSWTAVISGCVRHVKPGDALELYRAMQKDTHSRCSGFSVSSALAASADIQSLHSGKDIHGHIMRMGLNSDAFVWSALSYMYGKCGTLEAARHIFDRTLDRDVVSWNVMITRYLSDGRTEEGVALFWELLGSGIRPTDFTFTQVLNACADNAAEGLGREVHGYMVRNGCVPSEFSASALVHMYSKCRDVEKARRVFNQMPQCDLVSFTSLITGYAQNGQSHEALQLFELLLKSGTCPDDISFVGVLSACVHAGLVEKGLQYFYSINEKHGLMHTAHHYSCIIDLLSRSGRFKDAKNIISAMPMKPSKSLWASLLCGCGIHGNLELAELAAEALFEIEPDNAGAYITLANIYAKAGLWSESSRIRKSMIDRGVIIKPGLSWIEIKKEVHVFLVGDMSHPMSKEIYDFLGKLYKRMKEEGYVPDTMFVLHDVEDEQKEQTLSYHSEKLALAFGILTTPLGTQIKIFKNLRICIDCHTAFKLISRIMERRVVLRDFSRFHCFEDGSCSCNDYW